MKSFLIASVYALALGSATEAATLTVGSGWSSFTFEGDGSAWSESYTFTLSQNAYLLVTDAFKPGDLFEV